MNDIAFNRLLATIRNTKNDALGSTERYNHARTKRPPAASRHYQKNAAKSRLVLTWKRAFVTFIRLASTEVDFKADGLAATANIETDIFIHSLILN